MYHYNYESRPSTVNLLTMNYHNQTTVSISINYQSRVRVLEQKEEINGRLYLRKRRGDRGGRRYCSIHH